jgi:hypothetical protein
MGLSDWAADPLFLASLEFVKRHVRLVLDRQTTQFGEHCVDLTQQLLF